MFKTFFVLIFVLVCIPPVGMSEFLQIPSDLLLQHFARGSKGMSCQETPSCTARLSIHKAPARPTTIGQPTESRMPSDWSRQARKRTGKSSPPQPPSPQKHHPPAPSLPLVPTDDKSNCSLACSLDCSGCASHARPALDFEVQPARL
ncbi:uncharacterized protein IWZ02DRAFT_181479 [Phyllosticta citriasiana]|uniref:Secreted protein n=1 Tax=Phyllosticta citriasiana TaxID=595635 RepID=A0ABR1KGV7_9PEZI